MCEIKQLLEERKKQLILLEKEKENAIKKAPEGYLRVSKTRKRTQFYVRIDPADSCGTYIQEKDNLFAKQLAQKDYDQKVLRSIEQEIKAIDKYLSGLPKRKAEEIYETLHRARQNLVTPIRETDEQFKKRWEQTTFRGKEIDVTVPLLFTEKGERVRSKSELIIADILYREGIPYRYECPIHLKGVGKVYPDFTVLNIKKRKEIYWEHLGMMDDLEYVENALRKLTSYEENGIVRGDNLILTWETRKCPINPGNIRREIQKYFKE